MKLIAATVAAALLSPVHGDDSGVQREELVGFLRDMGHSEGQANGAADKVCDNWPGSHSEAVESRRMKALQYLQTNVDQDDKFNHTMQGDRRLSSTGDDCGNIGAHENANCREAVIWSQRDGRWQAQASVWYHDVMRFTGMPYTTASLEDYQKASWCGMAEEGHTCGLPPCSCSYPPCDICRPGNGEVNAPPAPPPTVHDLGLEAQCAAHDGCIDMDGDCCPNSHGRLETCCGFIPPHEPVGPPVFDSYPAVPGSDEIAALDNGRFLGPLQNTRCRAPNAAAEAHEHIRLPECSGMCARAPNCLVFTFKVVGSGPRGVCKLYAESDRRYGTCRMEHDEEGEALFVKNKDGMHPHRLPDRQISGTTGQFMALGDWGSISCLGRASMHYLRPVPPGSDEWLIDHHAQENVANVMRKLSKDTHPFAVMNVGDNFYWGGIPNKERGGKGVHDHLWNVGYENVYNDEELMIPWFGVVGNHDYGGDGCFSDIRAQFDYTIKDLLYNSRWKMPSPYYSQLFNLDGFSVEFFMADSNMEDSHNGRHGGICAQHLCEEIREDPPCSTTNPCEHMFMVDEEVCKQWFVRLLQEQETWLEGALRASTADWKFLAVHHKPMGFISRSLMPLALRYGVDMIFAGHTHEVSFFKSWPLHQEGIPMLVVGAGGGAQGRPGCGHGDFCGMDQDYSLANLGISKDTLTISIHRHDEITLYTTYIQKDGTISEDPPTSGVVVAPPTPVEGSQAHRRPGHRDGPAPPPAPRPPPAPYVRPTFTPLPRPRPRPRPAPAPAPAPAPMDTEGACSCQSSGTVNGIETNRPGCAAHLGRNFGDFCYVEGTHCSGARFSRRIGLYWRRCTVASTMIV